MSWGEYLLVLYQISFARLKIHVHDKKGQAWVENSSVSLCWWDFSIALWWRSSSCRWSLCQGEDCGRGSCVTVASLILLSGSHLVDPSQTSLMGFWERKHVNVGDHHTGGAPGNFCDASSHSGSSNLLELLAMYLPAYEIWPFLTLGKQILRSYISLKADFLRIMGWQFALMGLRKT